MFNKNHVNFIFFRIGNNYSQNTDLNSDYFYFYSNFISVSNEFKEWKPVGIVLLILPEDFPLFIFSAIVSAVLGAGCGIIIVSNIDKIKRFENIFIDAGYDNIIRLSMKTCMSILLSKKKFF